MRQDCTGAARESERLGWGRIGLLSSASMCSVLAWGVQGARWVRARCLPVLVQCMQGVCQKHVQRLHGGCEVLARCKWVTSMLLEHERVRARLQPPGTAPAFCARPLLCLMCACPVYHVSRVRPHDSQGQGTAATAAS